MNGHTSYEHAQAHPGRADMIMGDYQFPHIHFNVTILRGAYTPSLGRLDHSNLIQADSVTVQCPPKPACWSGMSAYPI